MRSQCCNRESKASVAPSVQQLTALSQANTSALTILTSVVMATLVAATSRPNLANCCCRWAVTLHYTSFIHLQLETRCYLSSSFKAPLNSRLLFEFTKLDLSGCAPTINSESIHSKTNSSKRSTNDENTRAPTRSTSYSESCFLLLDLDPPNSLNRATFSKRFFFKSLIPFKSA